MERITIAQAAKEWGVSPPVARWLCEKGNQPPDYTVTIKPGKRKTFIIYKGEANRGEKRTPA